MLTGSSPACRLTLSTYCVHPVSAEVKLCQTCLASARALRADSVSSPSDHTLSSAVVILERWCRRSYSEVAGAGCCAGFSSLILPPSSPASVKLVSEEPTSPPPFQGHLIIACKSPIFYSAPGRIRTCDRRIRRARRHVRQGWPGFDICLPKPFSVRLCSLGLAGPTV